MTIKSYRYRIAPTKEQEALFVSFAGCSRFIWNELIRRADAARAAGEKFSKTAIGFNYEITRIKKDFDWLYGCSNRCLQASAKQLSVAYSCFFRRTKSRSGQIFGPPKFRTKKGSRLSFSYSSGVSLSKCRSMFFLPRVGLVKFKNSRDPVGVIKTASVVRSSTGKWFISVVVKTEIEHKPLVDSISGVDVGLATFAAINNGEHTQKIDSPRLLRRSERKLASAHRSLSRKKPGSSNWEKARLRLAVACESVANRRKDFQHKLSTKLVCENQAIGIETLCVAGMLKTSMAKSVMDAGLSTFIEMLKYKCEWYGRTLVEADKWYPSSKTCSGCGEVNPGLTLQQRTWSCGSCGKHHDRDENAAINLRNVATGYVETLNARGAIVRPGESLADCVEART